MLDLFASVDANFVWIVKRDQQFTKITWSAFESIEQSKNVVSSNVDVDMLSLNSYSTNWS